MSDLFMISLLVAICWAFMDWLAEMDSDSVSKNAMITDTVFMSDLVIAMDGIKLMPSYTYYASPDVVNTLKAGGIAEVKEQPFGFSVNSKIIQNNFLPPKTMYRIES